MRPWAWCFQAIRALRGAQTSPTRHPIQPGTNLAQRNLCPFGSVGRWKSAKEQIDGTVAAVDWLLPHGSRNTEGIAGTYGDFHRHGKRHTKHSERHQDAGVAIVRTHGTFHRDELLLGREARDFAAQNGDGSFGEHEHRLVGSVD